MRRHVPRRGAALAAHAQDRDCLAPSCNRLNVRYPMASSWQLSGAKADRASDEWAHLQAMLRIPISRFYRDRDVFQSIVAAPGNSQEIPVLVVVEIKITVERALQRLADPSGQMDLCRRDDNMIAHILDLHDAIERVFRLLDLFLAPNDVQDLVPVPYQERAAQMHFTCRELIVYPVARLANFFMRACGAFDPLPMTLVINRAALRADRRFVEFFRMTYRDR